jgi:hypothetical protein
VAADRTRGEEDEVDGGVDPSSGDDVRLGGGERGADPAHGAARPASAALPRVEPPQQGARVVHRRVPGAARQPGEDEDQRDEDDERGQQRRYEGRGVHPACRRRFFCWLWGLNPPWFGGA